jgi:hypothetical protein
LFAAVFLNDVEEAWLRLLDAERRPTQEEKDAALRWTLRFSRRKAMALLLQGHGASLEGAARVEQLDELPELIDCVVQEASRPVQRAHDRDMPEATRILNAVPAHYRAEVINWLSVACSALGQEDLVAGTTLTLDRYYAAQTRPVANTELHALTLAALSTEMKLANAYCSSRGQILRHLCQGQTTLRTILETEARMLSRLEYRMGLSTPMSCLKSQAFVLSKGFQELAYATAGARYSDHRAASDAAAEHRDRQWHAGFQILVSTAIFLLELAMYDVELEYRYNHKVLATASLGVALLCKGPHTILEDAEAAAVPSSELTAGLHAMLAAGLESEAHEQLRNCEDDLLGLWSSCAEGTSPWSMCYARVCAKHANAASWPDRTRHSADLENGFARFEEVHGISYSPRQFLQ